MPTLRPNTMRPLLLGVAGMPGAGKTSFARSLATACPPLRVVSMDDFYFDLSQIPEPLRHDRDFDTPAAFDIPTLLDATGRIRRGEPCLVPQYDFATSSRAACSRTIEPAPAIIFEGAYLFAVSELRAAFDLCILIDTDPAECLRRRLRRDIPARSWTRQQVIERDRLIIRPAFDRYVAPHRASFHRTFDLRTPDLRALAVADTWSIIDRLREPLADSGRCRARDLT